MSGPEDPGATHTRVAVDCLKCIFEGDMYLCPACGTDGAIMVSPAKPGDTERLMLSVAESPAIDTRGVIDHSGVPWGRARAALAQLVSNGAVTRSDGHHHGASGELCQCAAGQLASLPTLVHWHTTEEPQP